MTPMSTSARSCSTSSRIKRPVTVRLNRDRGADVRSDPVWDCVVFAARLALVASAALAASLSVAESSNLRGTVRSSKGRPLPDATVLIYEARPRDGPALICPSCYPDCRRSARTAADGTFEVRGLDEALVF